MVLELGKPLGQVFSLFSFFLNHILFHPHLLDMKQKHDVCHSFVPLNWESIMRLARNPSEINGWKSHEIKGRRVRLTADLFIIPALWSQSTIFVTGYVESVTYTYLKCIVQLVYDRLGIEVSISELPYHHPNQSLSISLSFHH